MIARKTRPWTYVLGAILGLAVTTGASAEERLETKPVKVKFYSLLVDFDEEHEMGSDVETEDISDTISEDGINGVAKLLKEEGDVQLMLRGESRAELAAQRSIWGFETGYN